MLEYAVIHLTSIVALSVAIAIPRAPSKALSLIALQKIVFEN